MTSEEGYFKREFEIDVNHCSKTLRLFQKEVGDVSCVVWDAALVLSKYLELKSARADCNYLHGKNIIELGAGVGCVGLTAACLGGNVVMTDLPDVIDLLQKNIEVNHTLFVENGGRATAKVLDWGSDLESWKEPQLLLLADCIYYLESVEPLVKTMCALSNDHTEILLCQEERISDKQILVWKSFLDLVKEHFEITLVPKNEQHDLFYSADICLMRLTKR